MRISIVVAFEEADFRPVAGKRFAVEVTGFAGDEEQAYLEAAARGLARDAGGTYDPTNPEVIVEIVSHVCGSDLDQSPTQIAWFVQNAIFSGYTLLDLQFRLEGGSVTPPQELYGVASHRQTAVFSIFEDKGKYYRRSYPWLDGVTPLTDESDPIDPTDYRIPRPSKSES